MESSGGADRIAVMIDADNTRAAYANEVLSEVAKYGNPTIRRVYGDWTNPHLSRWARILNSLGLRAMHQNASTLPSYNRSIASMTSDSDFTSLAHRLRESGKTVYVLGENKAPESLRNACDKFIDLAVVAETQVDDDTDDADDAGGEAEETPSVTINLQSALVRALNAVSDDEGWATLPALGNQLIRTHPSFDARNFAGPGARLSTLVTAQPYLETSGSGNAMRVRLKGTAPKRQTKGKPAEEVAEPTQQTAQQTTKKAPRKAAKKTAEKSPDKPAEKTASKRSRTPAKRATRQPEEPAATQAPETKEPGTGPVVRRTVSRTTAKSAPTS